MYNIPYTFSLKVSPFFGKVLSIASVPSKACPGNCIHCSYGKTTYQTVDRQSFYALRHNSAIIKDFIDQHNDLDYIEISGPGEVGLNAELNLLIDDIRKATSVPIHIDSCGSLCWRISVHNDFCKADAVTVRIDAADREMYHKVNAVHQQIPFERYLTGIRQFRSNFNGDFYVKTCLVDGVNTDDASIYKLNALLRSLSPNSIFVSSSQVHVDNREYPVLDHDRLVTLSARLGPQVLLSDIIHQCA
jgi:wyosine [tRNA(Phe)-imidazoG37] synthetase (radical SAM superfamily)